MASTGKDLSDYDKNRVPNAKEFRFGLVVAEWNEEITEGLCRGAIEALKANGVLEEKIVRWNVPGSFELIYACKKMQESFDMLDAIIAIGSVIEGETKHFEYVCQGVAHGIKDLNVQHDIPVIFCVLTDQNMQQAIDRSGGKHGNKGTESGITAIKMAQLRKDAQF